MPATDKQISYILRLVREAGFPSLSDAANEYGLGFKASSSLSVGEASQMIEWLKSGARPAQAAVAVLADGATVMSPAGEGVVITCMADGRAIVKSASGVAFFAIADLRAI